MSPFALCIAACILRITSSFTIPVRESNTSFPRATSASASASSTAAKYVFAHHIVGNTFNFNSGTWARDVQMAHASGIDAFALNIGASPWEIGQVQSAYDAAASSGTGFKMFISLDMSSLPCSSTSNAQTLVSIIRNQASHPAQFRFGPGNKAFVSTFSGERCTFSAASPSTGWAQHFLAPLAPDIYFVPALFVDLSQLSAGDAQGNGGFGGIINGDFNWNSGWPLQLTTGAVSQIASNPSALASLLNTNVSFLSSIILPSPASSARLASVFGSPGSMSDADRSAFAGVAGAFNSDQQHINAIRNQQGSSGKTYMAAASPWFFTHYSPSSYNKNFIFLSDNHMYSKRWETLVATRDTVDLVEINSWNDFGESHYIGPIEGMQPNSQAWVDGNDHTGWLALTAYYAQAFKSGVYPTVSNDKVIMWARTHPRNAQASQDGVSRPTNFELASDSLWATVFVPTASTVTLSTSINSNGGSSGSVSIQVPGGVSHLQAPLTPGGGMRASISRGGSTVLDFTPQGYTFNPNPQTYNFNAFVAASA